MVANVHEIHLVFKRLRVLSFELLIFQLVFEDIFLAFLLLLHVLNVVYQRLAEGGNSDTESLVSDFLSELESRGNFLQFEVP